MSKAIWFISISALCLLGLNFALSSSENLEKEAKSRHIEKIRRDRQKLALAVDAPIRKNEFPSKIKWPALTSSPGFWGEGPETSGDDRPQFEDPSKEFATSAEDVRVAYTFDLDVKAEADRLLRLYKPDYSSIVLMEARSGRLLTMTSYQRTPELEPNLAIRSSFPAASVFKVVTAAAAVDRYGLSPDQVIRFNGGNYTLYKQNVLHLKTNRWTRSITLRDAFARSINTAFGRLALSQMVPQDLRDYSDKFAFNKGIPSDFPVDQSYSNIPSEPGFAMAEAASGYNKITRMSPVQGALIAAAVANDGVMPAPYMVENLEDASGRRIYKAEALEMGTVVSPDSAVSLRELMAETIEAGTSRKSFRPFLKDRKLAEVEVGGKTGHLNSEEPKGQADWFIGYAIHGETRLAIAVITVNKKFWTVKSAHMAQALFKYYFHERGIEISTPSLTAGTTLGPHQGGPTDRALASERN